MRSLPSMGYTSLIRWIDASLRILYSFIQNLDGGFCLVGIQAVAAKVGLDEMWHDTTFLVIVKNVVIQDDPAVCFGMAAEPLLDSMTTVIDFIAGLVEDMQAFPLQFSDQIQSVSCALLFIKVPIFLPCRNKDNEGAGCLDDVSLLLDGSACETEATARCASLGSREIQHSVHIQENHLHIR